MLSPASRGFAAAARNACRVIPICAPAAIAHPPGRRGAAAVAERGRPLRQFIGDFELCRKMLLHENSVVRIDPEMPLDQRRTRRLWRLDRGRRGVRSSGLEAGQSRCGVRLGEFGLSIVRGGADQRGTPDRRRRHVCRGGDRQARRRDRFRRQRREDPGPGCAQADRRVSASITPSRQMGDPKTCRRRSRASRSTAPRRSSAYYRPDARSRSRGSRSTRNARCQTSRIGSNRSASTCRSTSISPPGPPRPRRHRHQAPPSRRHRRSLPRG